MYATKKKTLGFVLAITALSLATILFATLTGVFCAQRNAYRTRLENAYERAFYELVSNVENMEYKLAKLGAVSGARQRKALLTELSRQADEAEYELSELPAAQEYLRPVSRLLNQINGYSAYLLRVMEGGGEWRAEYGENLDTLQSACQTLSVGLAAFSTELSNGGSLTGAELAGKLPAFDAMLQGLDHEVMEYPELIFDGPFSDARAPREPKALGIEEVSSVGGAEILQQMLPDAREIAYECACEAREIDVFCYTVKRPGGDAYAQVTKRGGKLVLLDSALVPGEVTYTEEQAVEAAVRAAEAVGYPGLTAVWYAESGTVATVNLAPTQDGVVLYPDLVKVKVSLSDAALLGIEGFNYLFNHAERELQAPETGTQSAKREISDKLTVLGERLAVIPQPGSGELLAWEISAERGGRQFFIYQNASTGEEVEVFCVVDTDQGKLLI